MKLRARWVGLPPQPGDYLMSDTRPRFAYRVLQVVASSKVALESGGLESRKLQIEVDRIVAAGVPPQARVHPWKWDRRGT